MIAAGLTPLAAVEARRSSLGAIDARRRDAGGWDVYVKGGRENTGLDAIGWAQQVVERGAGELLLTSMDGDGTQKGYDLELTAAIADAVPVPVTISMLMTVRCICTQPGR